MSEATSGRQTGGRFRLTEENVRIICDVLGRAGTLRQAEIAAGMSKGHLTRLLQRGEEDSNAGKRTVKSSLYQNATRAREAGKKALIDFVWQAATTGFDVTLTEVVEKDGVKTTRVKKTTFVKPELALEILARRWPDEWGRGDRTQVDDMPKEDPRDKDPEEREHLLRILSKKYAPRRKSHLDGITRNLPKAPGQNGDVGANGSGNGQPHEPDEEEPPPARLNGKA